MDRSVARDTGHRNTGYQGHETHFSTQPAETGPHPRLPCPDGHPRWPQGAQRAARQRACATDPLNRSPAEGTPTIAGQRFPRSARLLEASAYSRVFERRQRVGDPYFTLLWYRHGQGPARLGLAIARKQVRRAVDRNRLKRVARECFRQQREALHGIDLVVMARAEAAGADKARLRESLERLIRQIRKG